MSSRGEQTGARNGTGCVFLSVACRDWMRGSTLAEYLICKNLRKCLKDVPIGADMLNGLNKLRPLLSKAIPPLIAALSVAGLARQSGFADLYVAILAALAVGVVCLLLFVRAT